jgi:hypothetical protein
LNCAGVILQRTEVQLAGGGNHRIDRAGTREQFGDAGVVGQVHAQFAAAAAGGENLMLLAELAGDCLAEVPLAPTRRIFMAVPCVRE